MSPDLLVRAHVELVPQPTPLSNWAACISMLVGFRDGIYPSPRAIATLAGMEPSKQYEWRQIAATLQRWWLYPMSTRGTGSVQLARLLRCYGPIWLVDRAVVEHAAVLVGIKGSGMPESTLITLLNASPPGVGAVEYKTFSELDREYHLTEDSSASLVVAQAPGEPRSVGA